MICASQEKIRTHGMGRKGNKNADVVRIEDESA
jgi:hypothetical protein